MTKMKDAKVISSELIVDSFKKVVKERIQFTEDDVQGWIYLDSPKSIMVVALTSNRDLVLVNLYRHNLKQDVCELPAGGAEHDGETSIEAAKRELLEETGYASDNFIDLGSYYVLPSETNRRVFYYLALDVRQKHEPKLDDLIEKYFDMSISTTPFENVTSIKGASEHNITGLESLFGIRLAKEFIQAK
jgi:ADP-ribose pyrophosphatase YjhB (NUDIX family)